MAAPVAAAVASRRRRATQRTLRSMVHLGGRTRLGRYLIDQMVDFAMGRIREVSHGAVTLRFVAPNRLCDWRAATFASKEPETLEWIDAMPDGAVLWDVGANIGLYSAYAAKKRNSRVWAFEPSVFNLELLARNIHLNGLTDQICIVPLALSDCLATNSMRMTTTEWGGAMSTFGLDFGWNGEAIRQVFEFRTIGLSIDDAVQRLGIPMPDYVKMDVDGLEHVILRGGTSVLTQVSGVLIEVNDDFHEQAHQCTHLLTRAGLKLKAKRHSEIVATSAGQQHTFNQIWHRPVTGC